MNDLESNTLVISYVTTARMKSPIGWIHSVKFVFRHTVHFGTPCYFRILNILSRLSPHVSCIVKSWSWSQSQACSINSVNTRGSMLLGVAASNWEERSKHSRSVEDEGNFSRCSSFSLRASYCTPATSYRTILLGILIYKADHSQPAYPAWKAGPLFRFQRTLSFPGMSYRIYMFNTADDRIAK